MTPQRALLPAPPGSLPYTVELSIGDAVPFILKDGSRRTVTLKQTRLVFAHGEITVWATATVEVSGPGLEPQTAEIHAAYFNEPVVLNDVRVYVAQTKEFNPALRGSEVVDKDARLLLSDARYTMTDVSSYRWPFPSLLWQEGSHTTYWLGLQTTPGTPRTISHHLDGIDIGMPKNTRIHAWHEGTLAVRNRGFDRIVWLDGAADRQSGTTDHRLLHLDTVEPNAAGTRVKPGDFIGLSGRANWWHTHIVGGFRWGPMLAEWYTAHASPVERSYIKDWLIAGPFYNPSPVTRLDQDYVGGEAAATPAPGAPAGAEGKVWRTWDNVVPGVVLVGEAVDLFPFSGWAWVNGNHVNGVAYLATYIRSTQPRNVVLNIGASDSVKVWLGERLVFISESCVLSGLEEEGPTIIVDQHKVPVSLTAGWNRLLVKVAQRDGCPQSWQLSVRVSDEAGAPIPDLAISPLMDPSRKVDTMLVGAVAAAVATPVLTPTPTPSPRPTPVPSPTPVPPAGFTPLPPTPTSTPVPPPTPSPAPLPTATPIPTATPPPTPTPVPTATPVPPTATPIPVPTATPVPPATSTPVPTATPVPPTATPLLLPTATTAPVPTATATPPPTPTPPVTITIGPFSISLTLDLSATDSRRGDSDARAAIDKKSNRVQGGTGTAEYSHW